MTGMIANAGQFLDQGCDSGKRPQVGLVATADRPSQQSLHHLFGLSGGQLGLTAGLSLAGEALLAALDPGGFPTISDLPAHSENSAHLGDWNVFLEEVGSPNPPLFHLNVVTLRWHDPKIDERWNCVTLLCESQ